MDAVRWAFKQNWEFKKPTTIIVFDITKDPDWITDNHIEMKFGYEGEWLKSNKPVTPDNIKVVITQSRWNDDVKLINSASRPDTQSYFSWV